MWWLLKRYLADRIFVDLDHLARVIKRTLKRLQCRPDLIDGCLAGTGLIIEPAIKPPDITSSS
ncbi:hypothetical protein [Streptomyces sp. NPDC001714]|uniref:hypothetical protein n=1 Tax=Streptomyces sp. NPDC001714 TaxID=3364603 RepID=UPI00367DD959